MAIVSTLTNHIKYYLLKQIESDSLKIILMDASFVFDKDTHATLADVTSHQLATLNGYTQNSKELASVTVTEDDTDDAGELTCADPTFAASGGAIGPFSGACIYNDTASDDTVIGFVDLGVDVSIADGFSFQFTDIQLSLS